MCDRGEATSPVSRHSPRHRRGRRLLGREEQAARTGAQTWVDTRDTVAPLTHTRAAGDERTQAISQSSRSGAKPRSGRWWHVCQRSPAVAPLRRVPKVRSPSDLSRDRSVTPGRCQAPTRGRTSVLRAQVGKPYPLGQRVGISNLHAKCMPYRQAMRRMQIHVRSGRRGHACKGVGGWVSKSAARPRRATAQRAGWWRRSVADLVVSRGGKREGHGRWPAICGPCTRRPLSITSTSTARSPDRLLSLRPEPR